MVPLRSESELDAWTRSCSLFSSVQDGAAFMLPLARLPDLSGPALVLPHLLGPPACLDPCPPSPPQPSLSSDS